MIINRIYLNYDSYTQWYAAAIKENVVELYNDMERWSNKKRGKKQISKHYSTPFGEKCWFKDQQL